MTTVRTRAMPLTTPQMMTFICRTIDTRPGLSRLTKKLLVFLFAIFSVAVYAQNQSAAGLNSLENFVKNTKSGRATFTQLVTSPAKEGQQAKTK